MSLLYEALLPPGLLAARPAFGSLGRVYFATDTTILYYDTGAAWVTYSGPSGAHDILSATHSDADPQAVTRGSLIYGDVTPEWTELVVGGIGEVLTVNAGGTEPEWAAAGGAGLYESYCCIVDQKAQNTFGGTFTSGAWRTRDINTEQADPDGIVAIVANQFVLDAGDYACYISANAYYVTFNFSHQARLYNATDAAVLILGQCAYTQQPPAATSNTSVIIGRFTVGAAKSLEIQHRCTTTYANLGFGIQGNWNAEIYTIAQFWKEA